MEYNYHSHDTRLTNFNAELHALVYDELAFVKSDVARVKSIVSESMRLVESSFFNVQNETNEHFDILNSEYVSGNNIFAGNYNHADKSVEQDEDKVSKVNTFKKEVDDRHQQINSQLSDAIMALQSEDIVGQLSDRIADHVADIRKAVDILSQIQTVPLQDIERYFLDAHKEVGDLKKKLSRDSSRKIVSQENMDDGDIDLF